jgi:CHAT domain-containing protein
VQITEDSQIFWENRLRQSQSLTNKFNVAVSAVRSAELSDYIISHRSPFMLSADEQAVEALTESLRAEFEDMRNECQTMLTAAYRNLDRAITLIAEVGLPEGKLGWVVTLVEVITKLKKLSPNEDPRRFHGEILHRISYTEDTYIDLRRSLSSDQILDSVLRKQEFVKSNKFWYGLYSSAILASMSLDRPEEAWIWVQKAKWRSIADVSGPSRRFINALNEESTHSMLVEQHKLFDELKSAQGSQALKFHRLIEELDQAMKEDPAFVAQQRDQFFSLHQNDWLFTNESKTWLSPSKIVFVDWFVPVQSIDKAIYMAVKYATGECFWRTLTCDMDCIRGWIDRNMTFDVYEDIPLKNSNGNKLLKQLNALVAPLATLTAPDDLVVLSPSGYLHNLPLHALDVDGQPLILRNLVVYSPSLRDYRSCLLKANEGLQNDGTDTQMGRSAFFGVYEDVDLDDNSIARASKTEQEAVYHCINDLAHDHAGFGCTGSLVTPKSYADAVEDMDWVHYHGHVHFDKSNVLEQALVLTPANPFHEHTSGAPEIHNGKGKSEVQNSGHFTLSDVFDLSLKSVAPVFILVGCESGVQRVAEGDELLGLTTAFTFAGAASTLSCLWPIPSVVGRAFTEKFYENLDEQTRRPVYDESSTSLLGTLPSGAVNLAQAVREAVKAIKQRPEKDMLYPYHWAAFVLQGSWFGRDVLSPRSSGNDSVSLQK